MRSISILLFGLFLFGCSQKEEADRREDQVDDNSQNLDPDDSIAGRPLRNLPSMLAELGLGAYHNKGFYGQGVTVAILDNGYSGLEEARGVTLPPQIEVQDSPQPMADTFHGTKLAEVVYSLSTGKSMYDANMPSCDIKLFVTNGPYENLEHAVGQVIALKKADPSRTVIVLYSQIWEYGGNVNGTGFINALVNKALAEGVIWVNAAGNLGKSTYFGKVERRQDGGLGNELKLPYQDRYLRFFVESYTEMKIVLAWKDFANSYYYYRTSQDLDLVLEDNQGKVLGSGSLIQDGKDHGKQEGYSRHAREVIRAALNPGEYRLRVIAKSNNFDQNSRFWVTADGMGFRWESSNGNEVVFMPADNPEVVTVGASDVDYGNSKIVDGRYIKPEVVTGSLLDYGDNMKIQGTSTAAAIFAGTLAVFRSAWGPMIRQDVFRLIDKSAIGIKREQARDCKETDNSFQDCKITLPLLIKLPDYNVLPQIKAQFVNAGNGVHP
ncbi:MAG: hypothetical protein AB7T49_05415 [Oligoflexales bacterium]